MGTPKLSRLTAEREGALDALDGAKRQLRELVDMVSSLHASLEAFENGPEGAQKLAEFVMSKVS